MTERMIWFRGPGNIPVAACGVGPAKHAACQSLPKKPQPAHRLTPGTRQAAQEQQSSKLLQAGRSVRAGGQAHQGQAGHLGAPIAHGLARGHVKLGAVGGAGDAAAEGEVGASAGGDSR